MNWQPIATAPRNGNTIILGNASEIDTGQWAVAPSLRGDTLPDCWMAVLCEEDPWYAHKLHFEPTHWMPFPKPPTP